MKTRDSSLPAVRRAPFEPVMLSADHYCAGSQPAGQDCYWLQDSSHQTDPQEQTCRLVALQAREAELKTNVARLDEQVREAQKLVAFVRTLGDEHRQQHTAATAWIQQTNAAEEVQAAGGALAGGSTFPTGRLG